jgi:protein AbiQ
VDFYIVSDAYIEFLFSFDPKVFYNKSATNTRPYVGIVLETGGHKYLAPLTSYKPKQDSFRASDPRIFKIHAKGDESRKLGMVSFNNMIPVIDSEISKIDFRSQPEKYRRLLLLQHEYLSSQTRTVLDKARKLHELVAIKGHAFIRGLAAIFCCLKQNIEIFTRNEGSCLSLKTTEKGYLARLLIMARPTSLEGLVIFP